MSKSVSDLLHRFIKALTPAEKRYFKLFASRHTIGDKNEYLRLFESIDKMKEYDDELLRKTFKKLKARNSLAIAKNRLYETILKSLDAFYSESSVDVQLRSLLHSAEILYRKSLYEESKKMLLKARRIAERTDRHTILIDISKWDKKLIEKDGYTTISEDEISKIAAEDNIYIQKSANYNEFWELKSKLFFLLNRQGKVRDEKEVTQFKELIDNTLLKKEENALSFESKYLYYHIYSAYYFGTGAYKESHLWLSKQLAIIESNPSFIKEEPNKYFAVLSNLIYLCSRLSKTKEIQELSNKLHNIHEHIDGKLNEDLSIKIFSTLYSTELSLYLQQGEYEKAALLIPEIEEGLKKYEGKLNKVREAFFVFNISILHFVKAEYNKALFWINRLLNDQELDANQEIYAFARIFDLVIHLEIGNNDLIPYTLKSVQRYLTSRKRMYRFETLMLDFVKKLSKANSNKETIIIYKELQSLLEGLKNDPFERMAFEYFDFTAWVDAKISNTTFDEVIKKRIELRKGFDGLMG